MNLANFKDPASLKDRVYDTLKMEIILGRLKAGEGINMLELSNLMNVSSVPIREALNMLAQDGFVALPPHRKAIISNVAIKDYPVVMELRLMLEPYAAKMSTGLIPKEKISEMRALLKQVLDNPDDVYEYVASDLAFHRMLHQYAGTSVLSDVLTTVKEHSLRIHYCMKDQAERDKQTNVTVMSTQEHMQILDALENGDPDEVYREVRNHLRTYVERTRAKPDGILDAFMKVQDPDVPA